MLSKFAAVAAIAMSLVYNAAAQSVVPNCARNYTVHLFDTCNSISAANNVSTFQLAHVNAQINSDCSNLSEGEPLCLGVTGQDCQITHVVQSGDLCTTIAAGADITVDTLQTNNPNINADCSNIDIGEVLCTSGNVIHYT